MFRKLHDLEGFRLRAEDGEIGHVTDLYFDDDEWTVRYLVVATGNWFFGRKVLVSPNAVSGIVFEKRCIRVSLSMDQVRNSPDIDTEKPVSRQQESEYHLYYNFPPYWGGVALWGRYDQPGSEADAEDREAAERGKLHGSERKSHLRSAKEVRGYRIAAVDGPIGHLDNFLMEVATWAIRYLVVNTGRMLKKHEVVMTPKLVDRVIWAEAQVNVNASKALIESAPAYTTPEAIDRRFEEALFGHYTTHPYWERETPSP